MSSSIKLCTLPPIISSNCRDKVEAAQIPIKEIKLEHKHEHHEGEDKQEPRKQCGTMPAPMSAYPLQLALTPTFLQFDLFEEPVVARLCVQNINPQPIYLQCCGLWYDSSRLGASWCLYPRKRFWLPAGLKAVLYIKATPRSAAPLHFTQSALQIAAGHMRDLVTGYFVVPVRVCFQKYKPPPAAEDG